MAGSLSTALRHAPTRAGEGGAYPFTDNGLIAGRVDRIRLAARTPDRGKTRHPVSPGMAVQAEIKTAERRIIQYLLSPIAKAADEAGRER
jgi:hemolysin D